MLPLAVSYGTTTRVSRRDDDRVMVHSGEFGSAEFTTSAVPGDVAGWASYVAGVLWAMGEAGHKLPGLDISIASDVPAGAGLSSSAALTCSVGSAVDDELGLGLDRITIASLARRSENDFAGAPTGLMDQLASMLCEEGAALLLDCRSLRRGRSHSTSGCRASLAARRHPCPARVVDGGYGARRADAKPLRQPRAASLEGRDVEQVAGLSGEATADAGLTMSSEIERMRWLRLRGRQPGGDRRVSDGVSPVAAR